MAEVFGPDGRRGRPLRPADAVPRRHGRRVGQLRARTRRRSPPPSRDGINACIDQFGDKLPIEFQLLGFKPKKWQPEDVLGRMSGIYMSQNFRNEIARARLIAAVGVEKARWLAPVDPPRDYASPTCRPST